MHVATGHRSPGEGWQALAPRLCTWVSLDPGMGDKWDPKQWRIGKEEMLNSNEGGSG